MWVWSSIFLLLPQKGLETSFEFLQTILSSFFITELQGVVVVVVVGNIDITSEW